MWRSVKVDGLSHMANLCWSKDNVMAQVIREVAWNAAKRPPKMPQTGVSPAEIAAHAFECSLGPKGGCEAVQGPRREMR